MRSIDCIDIIQSFWTEQTMAMHACYFIVTLHPICVKMTLGWCASGQLL